MSDRLIDPNLKFAELYVDELHWIHLTEMAKEKGVPIDKLLGIIIEHFLHRAGRIKEDEISETPLKVEVTLEPVRQDEEFMDALIDARELTQSDRKVASMITQEDLNQLDWKGI